MGLPLLAGLGGFADSPLEWHLIGEDAWMVQGGGGNTTVLVEAGGAVVVDLKLGGVGLALHRQIQERLSPVHSVIITHHHGDHAAGFHAFPSVPGYVQRAAAERIRLDTARLSSRAQERPEAVVDELFASLERDFRYRRSPETEPEVRAFVDWIASANPNAQVPTQSVGEKRVVRVGRSVLELTHPGPAHTDNDLFVFERRRNLLVTGDLLFHHHHPFVDVAAGATTAGWERALDLLLATARPDTIIVSGHGAATDRASLLEQKRYFQVARQLVRRERRAGRSREDIVALPNREFADYRFDDLWPENLGILYDELTTR
jgi:glyoxylase-like metal-dependent hydrolase (beta-lactamase superfamily II)